ncbi:hypothetical protein M8818_000540 [Zalaria obscura]|uniref:Uncharacterized protein n=1 Tax=Zalaria obscura TaxID=2024903 RepID=A0ACC3SN79_9PEZI
MEASLTAKIQELGDLELAALLCLIAGEHCIITTKTNLVNDVAQELLLICQRIFGLTFAVVECSENTSLDDFREAVLVDGPDEFHDSYESHPTDHNIHLRLPQSLPSRQPSVQSSNQSNRLDERRVADVVLAKNLSTANHQVQIQALELIRTKRLFSHTAMHATSHNFLLVVIQPLGLPPLTKHLNDLFAISHHHSNADGFPNLEDASQSRLDDGNASIASSNRSMTSDMGEQNGAVFSQADIDALRHATVQTHTTAEVMAHLHHIPIFMKLSRWIAGGVSAMATRQLRSISRALAPLHGVTYVTPSLVQLAARKVYPHRLVLATTKTERSLQWGSDVREVERLLKGMTVQKAIDDVLASVETPL